MNTFKEYALKKTISEDIGYIISIIETVFDEYGWIFVAEDEVPDLVKFEEYYREMLQGSSDNGLCPQIFSVTNTKSGEVVGCIALKFNREGAYLSRVYLHKKVRGLGLGRWMVEQIMDIATKRGHSEIHLWTDTRFLDAHKLYEKLGFKRGYELRSLHDTNKSFEWKMIYQEIV